MPGEFQMAAVVRNPVLNIPTPYVLLIPLNARSRLSPEIDAILGVVRGVACRCPFVARSTASDMSEN